MVFGVLIKSLFQRLIVVKSKKNCFSYEIYSSIVTHMINSYHSFFEMLLSGTCIHIYLKRPIKMEHVIRLNLVICSKMCNDEHNNRYCFFVLSLSFNVKLDSVLKSSVSDVERNETWYDCLYVLCLFHLKYIQNWDLLVFMKQLTNKYFVNRFFILFVGNFFA